MVTVKYRNKKVSVERGTILSDAIRLMEEKVETPILSGVWGEVVNIVE